MPPRRPALDTPLQVLPTGHHVSRVCDFIMYSVEAAHIASVVAQFGPCRSIFARPLPARSSATGSETPRR